MTDSSPPEPDVDVLTGTLVGASLAAAGAVLAFGLALLPPVAAVATAILAFAMVLVTLTDVRHYIIPDVVSLPAIPLGIIANIAVFHSGDWSAGLWESFLGAAIGGGVFLLLREGYFRLRGVEGLGLGDVKLAAVAGAWLGPFPLPTVCLLASLAAILAVVVRAVLPGSRQSISTQARLPFGSFIAPFILIFWLMRMPEMIALW